MTDHHHQLHHAVIGGCSAGDEIEIRLTLNDNINSIPKLNNHRLKPVGLNYGQNGDHRLSSHTMRRILLIFLMWLVPFQAAWSAGHALHGHLDATTAHSHDHEHDQGHDDGPDLLNDEPTTHSDEGLHGSHGHAAFTFMITDLSLGLSNTLAAQPPPALPASFTSHIPLLPDPPPAVRI